MPSESDLRVSKLFDFSNHVVLVTGGASGIGEMAAQGFIQNGAKVYIASRKESELKKATDRFNMLGPGTCEYIVADLKDKAGCDHLVKEMKKRTDRLTVLVNNTGVTWGAPYDDFPESGWDKVMALNVKSVFYMTAGLQPLLLNGTNAAAPSRVINIASMAGISTSDVTSGEDGGLAAPGHGTFSYGPSKAACIHLSKILASKLAPLNIMVNCVCPGVFPSRMTNFGLGKFADTLLQVQPTGRVGTPSDMAGLILFLSSTASAHMTGNVLEIDGGSTISGWRSSKKSASKI
jgi:NAD(P)-dependent dehydrogenase (short-subunit alcohol dehydrogenase family)